MPERENALRWYTRVGAVLAGLLVGAIPGTVVLLIFSSFVGFEWARLETPLLICAGVGAVWGLVFPEATLDYAVAFLAPFG